MDYLRWRHKVDVAEEDMRAEPKNDRSYAEEFQIFTKCADGYFDRLETDLLKHDTADIGRLYQLGRPFQTHPWTATAWDATLTAQIADHMPRDRFRAYAETFRRVNLMRDAQYQLRDSYVDAMMGRFGLSVDAKVLADELVAAEHMKVVVNLARILGAYITHDAAGIGVDPDEALLAGYRKRAAHCEAVLAQAR